jgi:alkylhydroperoxidase family enzyme
MATDSLTVTVAAEWKQWTTCSGVQRIATCSIFSSLSVDQNQASNHGRHGQRIQLWASEENASGFCASQRVTQRYRESAQTRIGFNLLLRGILTSDWSERQQAYLIDVNGGVRGTEADTWSSRLSTIRAERRCKLPRSGSIRGTTNKIQQDHQQEPHQQHATDQKLQKFMNLWTRAATTARVAVARAVHPVGYRE